MSGTVAIIGAGQIGGNAAWIFGDSGHWDVRWLSRGLKKGAHPHGVNVIKERYVKGEHPAPEADVVIDTIAFDEDDVARYDPENVGRLIVISSASVYCDDEGRTLDEAAQNGWPEFGGPVTEAQSTVAPGPETYSTRKIRMENKALEMFGGRATILRPCAIYGVGKHPREWWFVKRMIDGRKRIPLAHRGRSQFQTTNAEDIAYFAREAAEQEFGGIYNIADNECPTVLEIGQAIASSLEYSGGFVPLEESGVVGRTPWSVAKPFTVSNATMKRDAYYPPSTYVDSVDWVAKRLRAANPADWRTAFPQLAAYPWDLFDYEAEDRFFTSL